MKVKTHNLKWYLFAWSSKLLNCFLRTSIILWLVCLCCSNKNLFPFLLTWICSCTTFQYFGWKIFTSCKNFRGQPWRCAYFGAKLVFMAGIFLKKYPWYMKIYFQFYFFAIWSITASILPIIPWKGPASSWSLSELAMFFNIDPRCFRPFGKFQDANGISMKTVRVSWLSFRFFWICS